MSFASYSSTLATFDQTLLNVFIIFVVQEDFSTSAGKSNSLNLNRHALGKLLDRNARASGLVGEVLLVDGVHLGEVVHGGDEDVDLIKRESIREQSKQRRRRSRQLFPSREGLNSP